MDEHDFPSDAECKAVPFGVYDVAGTSGYVVVGMSNNTPEFAADAIAGWWEEEAGWPTRTRRRSLILADGGGGNGSRARVWKLKVQELLCDAFGLEVTVCHYPPGCSKWNPVEHRLFSQISTQLGGQAAAVAGGHARLHPRDHDHDRAEGDGPPGRGDLPQGVKVARRHSSDALDLRSARDPPGLELHDQPSRGVGRPLTPPPDAS